MASQKLEPNEKTVIAALKVRNQNVSLMVNDKIHIKNQDIEDLIPCKFCWATGCMHKEATQKLIRKIKYNLNFGLGTRDRNVFLCGNMEI